MNTNQYQLSHIPHQQEYTLATPEQPLPAMNNIDINLKMEQLFSIEKIKLVNVDFIYAVDVAGQGICFERNMGAYLGYPTEQLKAIKVLNLLHPEEQRQIVRLVGRIKDYVRNTGKDGMACTFTLCHHLKKSNGQYIKILRSIRPLSADSQQHVTHYYCMCLDVSRHHLPEGVTIDVRLPAHFHQTREEVLSFFAEILSQENPRFSDRELEVLRVWSSTDSTEYATSTLGISERTIETHLKNMRRKLGVRRTMDVVLFAKERGWV